MGRIMAIDFGMKRTGIAVTDELQLIASPLDTVETNRLVDFLEKYFNENQVQEIVIGLPIRLHGEVGDLEVEIQKWVKQFQLKFPEIPIFRENETFTSKMASDAILLSGAKKKKRQDKSLIDQVSATIILQSYMQKK